MDVDKQTWKIHNQDKYYMSDLLAKFSLYSSKLQNIQFLVLGDNCHLIQSVKFLEFIYALNSYEIHFCQGQVQVQVR